ncbi:a44l protein-like protein [Trypanosoma theileri]|uniref:A44l protein-like protein n=1 Tax=Trypanosoma theileri TaxID=67003 RepID=A0A1X0NQI9_9TRYP|nr:a44l protein-like protein [Trypanosoma theileri]ORC86985.1 a44l protein-like protein [Trypanosoma theileri]
MSSFFDVPERNVLKEANQNSSRCFASSPNVLGILRPEQSMGEAPLFLLVLFLAFLFLSGPSRAIWDHLMVKLRRRRGELRGEVVRTITGEFHRGDSQYRWSEDRGSSHSGVLFNAVLLRIASDGENFMKGNIWKAEKWLDKPSVLFLFDPLKSDSHLVLGSSSFEPVGYYHANVEYRAFQERSQLYRYTVLRLPTAGSWISLSDNIEVTYQRRRVNGEKVEKVDHTLYLKAQGQKSAERLESFVQQSIQEYVTRLPVAVGAQKYYFHMQNDGKMLRFKKQPLGIFNSFDTMFFKQKKNVIDLLDRFLEKRGRFAVEGFPHKIGFFVYGSQGTGKTSFATAVAAYTGRHVISVDVSMISTNKQLYDIFLSRSLHCIGEVRPFTFEFADVIFLLDDTDPMEKLVQSRDSNENNVKEDIFDTKALSLISKCKIMSTDKVSLSAFLNVLDGVVETPSRIMIMATRNPKGFDPALLRPGRFGYKVHMEQMHLPELIELLGLYFGTEETIKKARYTNVVKEYYGYDEASKPLRRLSRKDKARVEQCVSSLEPTGFVISGAIAQSICFSSTSLDSFLDNLQHHLRNK